MGSLWWTQWHWVGVIFEYFGFLFDIIPPILYMHPTVYQRFYASLAFDNVVKQHFIGDVRVVEVFLTWAIWRI